MRREMTQKNWRNGKGNIDSFFFLLGKAPKGSEFRLRAMRVAPI
jgi:hypothetical protein